MSDEERERLVEEGVGRAQVLACLLVFSCRMRSVAESRLSVMSGESELDLWLPHSSIARSGGPRGDGDGDGDYDEETERPRSEQANKDGMADVERGMTDVNKIQ